MDKSMYKKYLYEFLGIYFIVISVFLSYDSYVIAIVSFIAISLTHLENSFHPFIAYLFYIDDKISLEALYMFIFIQIVGCLLGYITAKIITSVIKNN